MVGPLTAPVWPGWLHMEHGTWNLDWTLKLLSSQVFGLAWLGCLCACVLVCLCACVLACLLRRPRQLWSNPSSRLQMSLFCSTTRCALAGTPSNAPCPDSTKRDATCHEPMIPRHAPVLALGVQNRFTCLVNWYRCRSLSLSGLPAS